MFYSSTARLPTPLIRRQPYKRTGISFGALLGLMFLSALAVSPAAAGDGNTSTLQGTWILTAPFFGPDWHAMVTFSKEGTLIGTGASSDNVNHHGVWEKAGHLEFLAKKREFVYSNEELALFADTVEIIELAKDGMSYVGDAVTELKLLDGTVIDEVAYEVFGTRMVLDEGP